MGERSHPRDAPRNRQLEASEAEGKGTGRLKPGLRTIAGVITEETYAALLAMRREREIPTMSKAVGEALREWALTRSVEGFKPQRTPDQGTGASGIDSGLKPGHVRVVAIQPWAEVRGLVREVVQDGLRVRVVLEDGGDTFAVVMPDAPCIIEIQVGMTVAIMRTDDAGREYVVRTLD